MMRTTSLSSHVASQYSPPWLQQHLQGNLRRPNAQPFFSNQHKLHNGAIEARPSCLDKKGLGIVSSRSVTVWAQNEEDPEQELAEGEIQTSESLRSSLQRANMVSKIFMAAFVWISLFFGISVMDNEVGGGRKGRRGPRQ